MEWTKTADETVLGKTADALRENGFEVYLVESGDDARKKVVEILPSGAEVLTVTSRTSESINLAAEINESGRYVSLRNKLSTMNRETQAAEMNKVGASPEWVVGSVHAVTQDGKILIASASGSQLPAYSYGARRVIWVVGSQKIVKDIDEGMKRIYEHTLPLESERARKAYGVPGSSVNKILIMQKERPGRITIILVKEALGF